MNLKALLKLMVEKKASDLFLTSKAPVKIKIEGRILPVDVPGKESHVSRKAVGVVGVIGPWNWPLHLCLRSIAPALVVGNAVVIKPASDTPVTAGLLPARILEEAGLPAGTLSVVVGSGSEVGEPLVMHPRASRDFVHRLHRRRTPHRRDGRPFPDPQAPGARARRQHAVRRAGRCRRRS